ncbi:hypothetical protein KI387_029067, partial [Taxus chinensis]
MGHRWAKVHGTGQARIRPKNRKFSAQTANGDKRQRTRDAKSRKSGRRQRRK